MAKKSTISEECSPNDELLQETVERELESLSSILSAVMGKAPTRQLVAAVRSAVATDKIVAVVRDGETYRVELDASYGPYSDRDAVRTVAAIR